MMRISEDSEHQERDASPYTAYPYITLRWELSLQNLPLPGLRDIRGFLIAQELIQLFGLAMSLISVTPVE